MLPAAKAMFCGSRMLTSVPGIALPLVAAMVWAGAAGSQRVANPPHSVRPYAVVTTLKPSSWRMRSISTGGMVAAPVTAMRRLDRSVVASLGCASIVRYKVGGPGSTVMRSAAMRSNTA